MNSQDRLFKEVCKMAGKKPAEGWNDVGAWTVDNNPIMGGLAIVEIKNDKGGRLPVTARLPGDVFVKLLQSFVKMHESMDTGGRPQC